MASENKENKSGSDRRKWLRQQPDTIPVLKGVELCQDTAVQIVNISRGGMLLETEARLRPDWKIELRVLTSEGTIQMDGTILRSSIHSLKGPPKYRTAIEFANPLDLLENIQAETTEEVRNDVGPTEGDPQTQSPNQGARPYADALPSILTVVVRDAKGACLVKRFSLNDK